jgi:hypothetical protein
MACRLSGEGEKGPRLDIIPKTNQHFSSSQLLQQDTTVKGKIFRKYVQGPYLVTARALMCGREIAERLFQGRRGLGAPLDCCALRSTACSMHTVHDARLEVLCWVVVNGGMLQRLKFGRSILSPSWLYCCEHVSHHVHSWRWLLPENSHQFNHLLNNIIMKASSLAVLTLHIYLLVLSPVTSAYRE